MNSGIEVVPTQLYDICLVYDLDLVNFILNDLMLMPELIPYLYDHGIVKPDSNVSGKRWGIDYQLENYLGDDPLTAAIHAAGAAIVFIDRGSRFKRLRVTSNGASVDKNDATPIANFSYDSDTDCFASAGGPIATSLYLHGNTKTWRERAYDSFLVLCQLEMRNSYRAVENMIKVATAIVEARWPDVKSIAKCLVKRETVSYEECIELLGRRKRK